MHNNFGEIKLKCFIASAFDKDDCDSIYDRVIIPVLRKYSIQPLRVDRIEHNDDIDDKIFSLIKDADFCIADLTYSRPSVYYEAGFVFGSGKPVIYIARSDHFKPKPKSHDPNEILRIHFDLQMKNIISWKLPNITFRNKLEKRIKNVIRPLIIKKEKYDKIKTEEQEFSSLSLISRQRLLIESVKRLIPRKIFSPPSQIESLTDPNSSFFSASINKSLLVYSELSITKKMIKGYQYIFPFYKYDLKLDQVNDIHIIYLSLNSVLHSRISAALPKFNKIDELVYMAVLYKGQPNITLYIHFIDNIKSISELNSKFLNIIDTYLLNVPNKHSKQTVSSKRPVRYL